MPCNASLPKRARLGFAGAVLAVLSFAAPAQAAGLRMCGSVDYNAMILRIIAKLPTGGGYSVNSSVVQMPTISAHNIGAGNWEMRVYDGFPSYCTSAAYALYTRLVADLHNTGKLRLRPAQIESFKVKRTMPDGTARLDGEGLYGIFNSNGAGTAALIHHTGTGFSFRDDKLTYARPGDFLKMFWNNGVGSNEQGHQVVYLGRREVDGRDMVCFWGSQRQHRKRRGGRTEKLYFAVPGRKFQDGYGYACRPRSDIKEMIFSRITCMEHLAAGLDDMGRRADPRSGLARLFVDEYLRKIRTTPSNHATLDAKYRILQAAPPAPVRATFADSGIAPLR
jgi:hypothetical protein